MKKANVQSTIKKKEFYQSHINIYLTLRKGKKKIYLSFFYNLKRVSNAEISQGYQKDKAKGVTTGSENLEVKGDFRQNIAESKNSLQTMEKQM